MAQAITIVLEKAAFIAALDLQRCSGHVNNWLDGPNVA
jgi:hypothetical protein